MNSKRLAVFAASLQWADAVKGMSRGMYSHLSHSYVHDNCLFIVLTLTSQCADSLSFDKAKQSPLGKPSKVLLFVYRTVTETMTVLFGARSPTRFPMHRTSVPFEQLNFDIFTLFRLKPTTALSFGLIYGFHRHYK